MRILIATTNAGKVREFRRLLSGTEMEVEDLSAYTKIPAAEETGRTFADNACLKASYYARAMSAWTLADDSGLAVDALNGAPGVHSARWAEMAGEDRGDEANNALLLRQLESVPDALRTARFVCSLAFSDPTGRILLTASDSVEGRVLRSPRGKGGFGYDPLFLYESHGLTTAELDADVKNQISHRGKAMRRMVELMRRHIMKTEKTGV